MQIAFPHLENCSPAQKWVSVLIYDVRTSSVIRYLCGFQLCTTFCIVCFGSFCYLYHSYNVKFWVRIRVSYEEQGAQTFSVQPYQFEPRVNTDERDFNAESLSGDESMEGGEELNPRMENSDWYVLYYLLHCNSFTDLRNKLLFGPDVVFVTASFFFRFESLEYVVIIERPINNNTLARLQTKRVVFLEMLIYTTHRFFKSTGGRWSRLNYFRREFY